MNQPWVFFKLFSATYQYIFKTISPVSMVFSISCMLWYILFLLFSLLTFKFPLLNHKICDFSSHLCSFGGFWVHLFLTEFLGSCKAQAWVRSLRPGCTACLARVVEHPTVSSRGKPALNALPTPARPGPQGPPLNEWKLTFLVAKAKKLAVLLDSLTQPSQIQSHRLKINTQKKPRLLPSRNTLSSGPPAVAATSCSPAWIAGEAPVWSPWSGPTLPAVPARVPRGPFIMKVRRCPFFA